MTELLNPQFWASLSGPGIATLGAVVLVWAVTTQRLVPGRQYRAERARGDKYEDAYREAMQALVQHNANQAATIDIVSSFRKEIAELTKGGR